MRIQQLPRFSAHCCALLMVAASMTVGCDKTDDPSAVTVKNLKYPRTLSISDKGGGAIKLSWQASNFEKKFEGYNIYGVKLSNEAIAKLADKGLEKGAPIQLLDDEGNVREETKTILQSFNYDTEKPLESADKTEPTDDSERKISFLPIHNLTSDKEPILPTCFPSKDNASTFTCSAYTADNVKTQKDKVGNIYANGSVSYDITGLTPGEQYCFVIFSVQDSGKEISQTSTNLECVTPSIEVTINLNTALITGAVKGIEFKSADFADKCTTTCPDIENSATEQAAYLVNTSAVATAASAGQMYFESYSNGGSVFVVPGKNCGVNKLGVRSGLDDSSLPNPFPKFGDETASSKALNSNGYSVPGASELLLANQAYIVACASSDNKAVYHLIYVDQATTPTQGTTMKISVRPGLTAY